MPYKINYKDHDIRKLRNSVKTLAKMYSYNVYLTDQNKNLKIPQLWGNEVIYCKDTYRKIDNDMNK